MSTNHIIGVCLQRHGDAEHQWHDPAGDDLSDAAGNHAINDAVDNQRACGSASRGAICPESAVVRLRSAGELNDAIGPVIAAMLDRGYSHRDMFAMRLALEEAIVNAVKHGNAGDPAKEVYVRFHVTTEEALAEVEDEGPGFDPRAVKDPLALENLERPCGRGLLLMQYYMTYIRYSERGNTVTLGRLRTCE
jgi:serine/threonine-protein kinase RsbW